MKVKYCLHQLLKKKKKKNLFPFKEYHNITSYNLIIIFFSYLYINYILTNGIMFYYIAFRIY